jgi:hypothetical protein
VTTCETPWVLPKSSRIRIACVLTASMERSSGVFLSSASPVHETNAVGMHSVASPSRVRRMKAGLVASHAV